MTYLLQPHEKIPDLTLVDATTKPWVKRPIDLGWEAAAD